jgi:hypothetical protein
MNLRINDVSETGLCLRPQVICFDRASPYLRYREIREDGDRFQSPKNRSIFN